MPTMYDMEKIVAKGKYKRVLKEMKKRKIG
jgi:hypothetical protein